MADARYWRLVELLGEYGNAKFGDEWWPSNANAWLGDEKGDELAELLESPFPNDRCDEHTQVSPTGCSCREVFRDGVLLSQHIARKAATS